MRLLVIHCLRMRRVAGSVGMICKFNLWRDVILMGHDSGKHDFVEGEPVRFFTRESDPGVYMSSSDARVASVEGDTVVAYLRYDSSRSVFQWSDTHAEYIRVLPEGSVLPEGKTLRQGVIRPLAIWDDRNKVNIPE